MADSASQGPVPPHPERTIGGMAKLGLEWNPETPPGNRLASVAAHSVLNPAGYSSVLKNSSLGFPEKAAYFAGRLGHDLLTDGSRIPWWALNHPLAMVSLLGELATSKAGLSPDYEAIREQLVLADKPASNQDVENEFADRMGLYRPGNKHAIPAVLAKTAIPAIAATTLTALSNNTNYLNILGGGRTDGFEAVMPVPGNSRESSNPILELAARYIFGRTGRVLPWQQFTAERPEVSEADYKDYAAYQFDKGPLGLGLVRATSRNLDAEPEATMLGFRVPFSAAAGAGGSILGAMAAANAVDQLNDKVFKGKLPLPRREGPRRLAGAALGGLAGAVAGKLGGMAVNNLVIQPALNPDRVALTNAWLAQQQALGLL